MGENEQGGMLRTVVVVGIVAMISAIMIFAVVGLTHSSKSQSADVVKNLQTAKDGVGDVQDDYDTSIYIYDKFDEAAKTVEIKRYKNKAYYNNEGGNNVDLVIPATVKKNGVVYRVTSIGASAFSSVNLKSVVMPNSITFVDDQAFAYNQIQSVSYSNKLTSIGYNAFRDNQLKTVVLPDSVTSIDAFAFALNDLTSIDTPSSLRSIGNAAFADNPNLETVTIHSDLQSMGNNAFGENLKSITFPDHNLPSDLKAALDAYEGDMKINYAS